MISKDREAWENLKSKVEGLYTKLGHNKLKATDPIVLSSIAVESEDIKRGLEKAKSKVETMAVDIEAVIKKKSKTRKPLSLKTPHQKQSKKRNVNQIST